MPKTKMCQNSFTAVSDTNLYKLIMKMPTKLFELHTIPTKLLKKILKHCMPTLTKIVNLSLNTGEFHDGWKSAIVRPIIKSLPKATIKTNYRPVSNLFFISTIVEKCTLEQFSQHSNNYDLLPSYQSAYRKFHDCETSLVKLVNDLLWAMEKKQGTSVVMKVGRFSHKQNLNFVERQAFASFKHGFFQA